MKLNQKRIGLIGVGNMGTSILEGLLLKHLVLPQQITVFDKLSEKVTDFSAKWAVSTADSLNEIVRKSEILLIAIKPQDFQSLAKEIGSELNSAHVLISILAGTSIEMIQKHMGHQLRIVRAMPNLGAKVCESLTAITGTDEEALTISREMFSGCGSVIELDEAQFDLITALSGSGPAYFFLLMECIEAKAIEKGIPAEVAKKIATQTACGASLLANQSKERPGALREQVTSKGGTTQAALESLKEDHIYEVFSKAFDAAAQRSIDLRGG